MRIQLWSYNYDPEPTGIGPVSRTLARGLSRRGHDVLVVAAHPHYPEPIWGKRRWPYRERRDGISVIRLPLWVGRANAKERYRQELSFTAAQAFAVPLLPRADLIVSASPCFPALLPAIVNARTRRTPWVLWLHDILPDGAVATGVVEGGKVLRAARWLERRAYGTADRIVLLSRAFEGNLLSKGVAPEKLVLIYDPATRAPQAPPRFEPSSALRILSMGNIGYSQGLAPLVEAFERASADEEIGARLIITGTGVAADDVRSQVRSGWVEMRGLVSDTDLEEELRRADIALVSQDYSGAEFNIPSKLMNFMMYGLPVIAAVNPSGEVARIVNQANAGWVVDSSEPAAFPRKVRELTREPEQIAIRARAAVEYAERHFSPSAFESSFEEVLQDVVRT